MRISKPWIIVIVFLAILVFTNPKKEDHVNELIGLISKGFYDDTLNDGNDIEAIGVSLGIGLAERMIENLVEVDNYIIFSIAKAERNDKSKVISYGFLGNVFLSEDAKEAFRK